MLLVIEVADSSVEYDRQMKIPLYARHAIPEVWLLDLPSRSIEIYREPSGSGYRTTLPPGSKETISPLLLPGIRLIPESIWLR